MSEAATGDAPRPGLRERKKARTRTLIQQHALRLFQEQGYDETTVEQIAEAAEVSPSTVFNYFPTKPDLVIYDDLDERMIDAYRSQPPELNAIGALRGTMTALFTITIAQELETQLVRERLIRTIPELRASMLDELVRTLREIVDLVAERSGRPTDDDEVVTFAGAVIGIAIAAWFSSEGSRWVEQFAQRLDEGLDRLESGFRL